MTKYRLSKTAKEDLIRIHQYGVQKFGMAQADKYFETFLNTLTLLLNSLILSNPLTTLKRDTNVAFVVRTVFIINSVMV